MDSRKANLYMRFVPKTFRKLINLNDLDMLTQRNKAKASNKCLLLVRVSTGHQDLEQQTIKVKEEALKDGYLEENIIIIEDIESAVKLSEEERNGLNRLKEYINNDTKIDTVYTYEISRISRRPEVLYSIRDFLINHSVNLIVLNPYFKMLKDDGTLCETSNIFFGIFSSLAEQEGYLRKARIKKARDRYIREGKHTGGNIMFGYDTDAQHNYIPHKENANIVREIFHMYVNKNMSIRHISRELYERGVRLWTCNTFRTPTSFLTMCTNVNNILHREEYTGTKNKPQIISRALFDAANRIMKYKVICTSRVHSVALLRGMIHNKANGFLLSANGATKYYYSKRASGPSISYECADNIIWNWIKEKHAQFQSMNDEQLMQHLNKENDVIEKKIMTQYNRKMELMQAIDRLEERIVVGKISAAKADEMSDKLQKEINELDSSYFKLQEQRIDIRNRMRQLDEMKVDLNNMCIDDKIQLVKQMIKRINIERIDRTKCILEIESNIVGIGNDILRVDSYHKRLF